MTRARRWRGWIRTTFLSISALMFIGAALSYLLADLLRAPLDDASRETLIRQGSADHFVPLTMGVMHVRETGPIRAPAVLLIHGAVIGGYGWRQWQQPLAAAGFHVITPDLFGYGFSARPDLPYTREFYTRQLTELLKALNIHQPVHVVGASMGGAVAAAFAAHAPERVQSVTLIAPAGLGRHSVVSNTLLLPGIGDWAFRVIGPRQATGMMGKAYPPSHERDALIAWMHDQGRYRGFGAGLLNTLRHYDTAWQPEDYKAIGRAGLPVLALWGTADTVNPFADSRQLRAWVPQVELVALPNKPHAITFGEAPLLLGHVLRFWTKHSAALSEHR